MAKLILSVNSKVFSIQVNKRDILGIPTYLSDLQNKLTIKQFMLRVRNVLIRHQLPHFIL